MLSHISVRFFTIIYDVGTVFTFGRCTVNPDAPVGRCVF